MSADARVIEAHALSIETAALTRESQPSGRTAEHAGAGIATAEARDGVFMATSVTTGTGKAVVRDRAADGVWPDLPAHRRAPGPAEPAAAAGERSPEGSFR